jgi:NADPH:quinone reductase
LRRAIVLAMKSRAVVMRRVGGPEVLAIEEVELAPLADGEVRIRSLASAINHSDLEIRAGNWPILREPKFPHVPGLEVVGEVVESNADDVRVGDRVWTMMQGLGGVRSERDGGYAEHVTVSGASVAVVPKERDPTELAALGLAALTAYEGLARIAPIENSTVAITGASGGVGSVAMEIAKAMRASAVIAVGRETELAPQSVDAILDAVAGPLFPRLIRALKYRGRYCLVGAIAGGDVAFDAWALLGALTLTGYSSEDLDGTALRAATSRIFALNLPAPPHAVMKLSDAARAHAMLERRELKGRVVLVP